MGFDTEILLPNLKTTGYNKTIDESIKSHKNQNFGVGYKPKLDDETKYRDLRVTSKIIKFDENNQYGFAMTKPMPTGSIKEKTPSWVEFNLLLERFDLDDKIGHLFVVDIKFDYESASDRVIMYNEVFPPIIEKKKTLDANERSVFQLCERYSENDKGKPKSYKTSPKSHSILLPKTFIPMYLEELKFLITRCGWAVTKLYKHYYFEQSRFKRNFIIMNQKSRQNSKTNIEKGFYKLLNNANFGYDCINNLDNCKFEPICDKIHEISYIRNYHKLLFDKELSPFINSKLLEAEIQKRFNDEIQKIKKDYPFRGAKVKHLKHRKASKHKNNIENIKRIKLQKKRIIASYEERLEEASENIKIKGIIDFEAQNSASIKSIAIKKDTKNYHQIYQRKNAHVFKSATRKLCL